MNVNMLAMIKSGATRLSIDRVPAFATLSEALPDRLIEQVMPWSTIWRRNGSDLYRLLWCE